MPRPRSTKPGSASLLPALFPVLVFLGLSWCFRGFTVDDAFISMRYARNLTSGHGLVFNPGERVEGFSNPLWVGLLALLELAGAGGWPAAKALGVLAGATVIFLLARRDSPGARFGAWLAAGSGGFAYYAVSGLEPALMALLLLALAQAWSDRPSWPRLAGLATLALAIAATRPEGLAVVAVVVLMAVVRWPRPQAVAVSAVTLCALFSLLLARHAYYGAWLPNTFLAKPGISDVAGLVAGLGYVGRALMEDQRWADGLIVALAALSARRLRPQLSGLLLASGVGFAVWSGGDWMERSRFLIPYVPLLALAAGDALAAESRRRTASLAPATVVVALLVLLRGASALSFAADLGRGGIYDHAHVSAGNVAIGRWLEAHTPVGAAILTDEIGAVGYFSGRRVLDFWGLVDRDVARTLREHGFNPYAGASPSALRSEVQRKIAVMLLDRGATFALVDDRGPADAPLQDVFVNPVTMRELVAELRSRGWTLERRFVLDRAAPKSFLLFRRPS